MTNVHTYISTTMQKHFCHLTLLDLGQIQLRKLVTSIDIVLNPRFLSQHPDDPPSQNIHHLSSTMKILRLTPVFMPCFFAKASKALLSTSSTVFVSLEFIYCSLSTNGSPPHPA